MVCTERAETAGVSRGTSHVSALSTPLRWIFKKTRYKKLITHVESHASAVSLFESGEQRYITAINENNKIQAARFSGEMAGSRFHLHAHVRAGHSVVSYPRYTTLSPPERAAFLTKTGAPHFKKLRRDISA